MSMWKLAQPQANPQQQTQTFGAPGQLQPPSPPQPPDGAVRGSIDSGIHGMPPIPTVNGVPDVAAAQAAVEQHLGRKERSFGIDRDIMSGVGAVAGMMMPGVLGKVTGAAVGGLAGWIGGGQGMSWRMGHEREKADRYMETVRNAAAAGGGSWNDQMEGQ